jgi:hypothetical protein
MISPTKLLVAAAITASAVAGVPAVAGACGWGGHTPPPHHGHHPCSTTTTGGGGDTSTTATTTPI